MPITVSLIALAPLGVVGLAAGPATAETTCDGKVPTILVVPGTPTTGTPGDDVILGTYAQDRIDGGAGNDTICGLGNADTLVGGPGDDRLFGGLDDYYAPDDGYAGDTLVPGPGNDFIDLGDDPASATVDYVDRLADYDRIMYEDAPGPVDVDLSAGTATGEGTDTIVVPTYSGGIVGSSYDDVLTGTDGPDRIVGGAGDDRIHALDGDDDMESGTGDDVVRGGDGEDIIVSPDKGRDRFYGDDGVDYVEARGRGSAIGGGGGDDHLAAHFGATVHGGAGDDEIWAELTRRTRSEVDAGDGRRDVVLLRAPKSEFPRGTRYVIDVPRKRVTIDDATRARYEGVEDVRFSGRPGSLTYLGGPGRDRLSVSGGMQVTAYGRRGADILVGGSRNDLLDGGPGRDQLVGGSGRDRCIGGEQRRQCEVRR
ncbi:calcium-binding protein [Nocardioides sp. SYSU D00065]|uniref:calcium-binding protein n=1 Tax=Nocardioides sp. SYSU D00065 TaxID=2817378 RepID=UPI001B3223AC|nr:calcium-binding protein [Nocardioides sp. SYSU D00065]